MESSVKRGRPRIYTDKKEQSICKEFNDGMSDMQLARKHCTSLGHIQGIRKRWGIVASDRVLSSDAYANVSEAQKRRWKEWRRLHSMHPAKRLLVVAVQRLRARS